MSARLNRDALCLCLLAKAEPALARAIMEKRNENLVRTLCECARNFLKGNVPLKTSQKRRLRRYKEDLRLWYKGRLLYMRGNVFYRKVVSLGPCLLR